MAEVDRQVGIVPLKNSPARGSGCSLRVLSQLGKESLGTAASVLWARGRTITSTRLPQPGAAARCLAKPGPSRPTVRPDSLATGQRPLLQLVSHSQQFCKRPVGGLVRSPSHPTNRDAESQPPSRRSALGRAHYGAGRSTRGSVRPPAARRSRSSRAVLRSRLTAARLRRLLLRAAT